MKAAKMIEIDYGHGIEQDPPPFYARKIVFFVYGTRPSESYACTFIRLTLECMQLTHSHWMGNDVTLRLPKYYVNYLLNTCARVILETNSIWLFNHNLYSGCKFIGNRNALFFFFVRDKFNFIWATSNYRVSPVYMLLRAIPKDYKLWKWN